MRQPDVIMTNMARALTQWVTRTQAGWIVAPDGACVIVNSTDPDVMAQTIAIRAAIVLTIASNRPPQTCGTLCSRRRGRTP